MKAKDSAALPHCQDGRFPWQGSWANKISPAKTRETLLVLFMSEVKRSKACPPLFWGAFLIFISLFNSGSQWHLGFWIAHKQTEATNVHPPQLVYGLDGAEGSEETFCSWVGWRFEGSSWHCAAWFHSFPASAPLASACRGWLLSRSPWAWETCGAGCPPRWRAEGCFAGNMGGPSRVQHAAGSIGGCVFSKSWEGVKRRVTWTEKWWHFSISL